MSDTPRGIVAANFFRGTTLAHLVYDPTPTTLSFLRSAVSVLISRRTARRLARIIPNPLVRYAIVTIATAVVPVLAAGIGERWANRRVTGRGKRWGSERPAVLNPDADVVR